MKNNIFRIFIFLLVLYFTFILRTHNYERTPTSNHLDEMLYAWSGIYLIETGTPVSWSTLDYPDRAEIYKGKIDYKGGKPEAWVTLYQPWLDQPPLFSLIVGSFAHWYEADRTQFIPSSYIRIPTVLMAALTSIMIFLIARLVSGYWTGILAMLVYGTVPIMVFGSRTALPENMIALLFSIICYLLIKFNRNAKFIYLLPIPFLIGIAGLGKPTGFLILPFALYFILKKYSRDIPMILKYSVLLIALTAPFVGLFFAYGLYYDPEIFWNITNIQSSRPAGFSSLAWLFISPAYATFILTDSWFVFCLLATVHYIFKNEEGEKRLVVFAFIYWVIIVMIFGGEGDLLPWYRFPAYPFLAIIGAWGLQDLVKKVNFFTAFLAAGFLLGGRHLLVNAFRPNITAVDYRTIFGLLLFPSIIHSIYPTQFLEKLTKIIIIGIMVVGMYMNVIYIYNEFEIKCESLSCPFVPSTTLSTIHVPFLWRFFVLGEPTYR